MYLIVEYFLKRVVDVLRNVMNLTYMTLLKTEINGFIFESLAEKVDYPNFSNFAGNMCA